MANYTIQPRKTAKGDTRYRCLVRASDGRSESKTFGKHQIAKEWGILRCTAIENEAITEQHKTSTIFELLNLFYEDHDLWSNTGRTKRYVIQMLMDCDIAQVRTDQLKASDIIQHCKNRREAGAGPATIYHDVAYLRSVMKKAKAVWDIEANWQVFEEAVPVLIDMKLVGKSQKRTRRPTTDELNKLRKGLRQRMGNAHGGAIPFVDILDFSILTCMRIGEVCRITWRDLDEKNKTVIVRDRKDPRKKDGNHMVVPLLGDSFKIIKRQPKSDDRIFPYNEKSVTAGFQRVRNALGITDLHYHDLRREGASRLFEAGYSIEEVAQVTGHRNLNILWQVYTQLYPHKLHDKFKAV
ncbi:tyrosine-type recombinase/integrase [Shewanella dokdonensis]|uniref:Site-specific integrase n=1 Tax=Shewanella dokdonensis TaxID=712036 RepID=A0ABX8DE63_9GAMM|nr:site-specific integrase [Shewanella dokdonensis]MCL1074814.1 site-specific integrase [Shewanella dokdonensis]QVK22212.1 site-specific integrase [Shewanella dokdonensis]